MTSTLPAQQQDGGSSIEAFLETQQLETSLSNEMMSPLRWESSLLPTSAENKNLPMFSPSSPSRSIEDLVLELEESSQDMIGSPFTTIDEDLAETMFAHLQPKEEIVLTTTELEETASFEEPSVIAEINKVLTETEGVTAIVENMPFLPCKFLEESGSSLQDIGETKEKTETKNHDEQQVVNDPDETQLAVDDPFSPPLIENASSPLSKIDDTAPLDDESTSKSSAQEAMQGSIAELKQSLAEMTHCHSKNEDEIANKATSTIAILRQQSCDLLSTYSQLKIQNDELMRKKDNLDQNEESPSLTIEVLIPSSGSLKVFERDTLFHHIPVEEIEPIVDESDSEIPAAIEEPYEEIYEGRMVCDEQATILCPKEQLACRLGCICEALTVGKPPVNHCKNINCMLGSDCALAGDPSHSLQNVVSILNDFPMRALQVDVRQQRRRVPSVKKREQALPRKRKREVAMIPDLNDPKLKLQCRVMLTRWEETRPVKLPVYSDEKLRGKCYVRVNRVDIKDYTVYCMEHRKHKCRCLPIM